MSRKTIPVKDVVTMVNEMLRMSECNDDIRRGASMVLEDILFKTNNYRGFGYLLEDQVPAGQQPGVRYANGEILPYPERFENTDDSRRNYYG